MIKRITIIGATGMIGRPVTNELLKAGFELTALVRDVDKAKKMFPKGVYFVKGDIENRDEIAAALKNADAVYMSIAISAQDKQDEFSSETGGLDNILSAVKLSQVKRVAFLSSLIARNYTGNWWVMNAKKRAITKVKNCGIPYTIFYPSSLMENFNNGMRDGKKINTIGKSIENAWWISGEDFGRQVANSFKIDNNLSKEYPVQGLEPLTTREAASIYIAYSSVEGLSIANLPMGVAKFLALFVKPLKFVVPLMEVLNTHKETFESQKTWDELGRPIITLSQYAKM
jgi:uncharacterized protein YbjT (DUF2867 family)